ncbi:WhiB family transcriptional regulator [Sinomonas sp. ASV322]|uniref:WhiB family transcriptional regulator n=1 Tax=Sinomonas sp. ASV322 TaxID=3041920 RepID=UPI0027DC9CB0|nr:WhiB family transcriptional regulator [Sinomonas sp. ASV322]MDQ4503693.1 WhiB family transcriptional regulator [Sinomonas sp. ASV322]
MGQTERFQNDAAAADQAMSAHQSRGIPADWYVDPADPEAEERYREMSAAALEDAATAFLAEHAAADDEAADDEAADDEDDDEIEAEVVSLLDRKPAARPAEPVWVTLLSPSTPVEGELAWQADALCAQTDPEAFFPEKGGSTRDAKKVCSSCTVRSECLEYALENDERFGIWGGLSERERRRLRKRAV